MGDFVAPLPEKVHLFAHDVERLAFALLMDPLLGIAARSPSVLPDDLVLRVLLTTSRSYKEYRRSAHLPHGLSGFYSQLPMPHFVWLVEITTKALYPLGAVIGEVLFDATGSDQDLFAWLAIHYPEYLVVNDRDS